jgi:dihydroflavonol-4-reductase
MNALVTGATGFLGNNLVRALVDRGDSVRVILRQGADPQPLRDLKIQKFTGRLEDEALLFQAAAGVDVIYHCAGYVKIGWTHLDEARRVNVGLTQKVATVAQKCAARFVHVSTVNTLGVMLDGTELDEQTANQNHVNCAYVVSKKEAEQAVQKAVDRGLDAVIVHPSFMLGPFDWKPSSGSMMLEVLTVRPPFAPRGGCSVADVRDVSTAIASAGHLGRSGENYILAGHNISYFDLWAKFANLKGRRGPYTTLGPILGWGIGSGADLWARLTDNETNFNSALVRMGAQTHYYRSDKARKDLGYENRPMEATIDDTWNWFCENGFAKA